MILSDSAKLVAQLADVTEEEVGEALGAESATLLDVDSVRSDCEVLRTLVSELHGVVEGLMEEVNDMMAAMLIVETRLSRMSPVE